jgi:hypothetical protein
VKDHTCILNPVYSLEYLLFLLLAVTFWLVGFNFNAKKYERRKQRKDRGAWGGIRLKKEGEN